MPKNESFRSENKYIKFTVELKTNRIRSKKEKERRKGGREGLTSTKMTMGEFDIHKPVCPGLVSRSP